jgi:ribosomal protein S18 acetylase RimI-like enzyme
MEYHQASQLTFDPHPQMGAIFAEGFYQWLQYFSKDKTQLGQALAHMFDLKYFFVALQNNEIAAITACTNGTTPPIKLNKRILSKKLGFFRGHIAYFMLNKHLVKHKYPFRLSPQIGSIEFVASAPKFRRTGAAYGLITHIIEIMPYKDYVLEAAGKNNAAIHLYKKLNFHEFMRTQAPKGSGEDHLLYLKREADL